MDELTPQARELLGELEETPGAPTSARAGMWEKIEASVGTGGGPADGGGSEGPPSTGTPDLGAGGGTGTAGSTVSMGTALMWSGLALLTGGIGGAALHASIAEPDVIVVSEESAPAPVQAAPVQAAPVQPAPAQAAPVQPAPEAHVERAPRDQVAQGEGPRSTGNTPSPALAPAAERSREDRTAERALLRQAHVAIGRGHTGDALRAIRDHQARFPGSAFVEERLALEIRARFLSGDTERARTMAERFVQRYPLSIFRGLVTPALEPG